MNRRTFNAALLGLAAMGAHVAAAQDAPADAAHPLAAAWALWKTAFLAPDGRVIDRTQQGASHSESQGYGMTLALALGDADAFARIDAWTEANLALRDDSLLAWRWLPEAAIRVPDRNNASDGDLFRAWALAGAGVRFSNDAYTRRATAIAADLARLCVVPWPDGSGRPVLLPAALGFSRDDGVIVNPSYCMPRALRELAAATGQRDLALCADSGEALAADLAATGLMPDWIALTPGGPQPATGMSDRSGYEAMRVPLFLLWSGAAGHPALARHAAALRSARSAEPGARSTPTVLDRLTGAVIERSPDAGYGAVEALLLCTDAASGASGAGGVTLPGSALPPFTTDQPYYPATLHLMALLAQIEGYPTCVPL